MSRSWSRDPTVRLSIFIEAGLVHSVPTTFQLLQAQLEMAPYVVVPDAGDDARYSGAPFGHPLLRTPLVFSQVGLDHLRVGHGLHSSPEGLLQHLSFVYHEGFPTYDLQLVHSLPGGLAALRRHMQATERAATPRDRRRKRLVDLVIPDASGYRRQFLEPGGWLDRAAAFDYPGPDETPDILRPEFASLTEFANYAARAFPARPSDMPLRALPGHLARLAGRRFSSAA